MNKPHITVVWDDDWAAVYFDGKQYTEGHSVRYDEVLGRLEELGILTYTEQEGTAGVTGGSFPEKLEDVQHDPDWTETYED